MLWLHILYAPTVFRAKFYNADKLGSYICGLILNILRIKTHILVCHVVQETKGTLKSYLATAQPASKLKSLDE